MWFPVHLANAILEFPSRPHACAMSLEDGKQEINLEWPNCDGVDLGFLYCFVNKMYRRNGKSCVVKVL